jgi:hypothetical protein
MTEEELSLEYEEVDENFEDALPLPIIVEDLTSNKPDISHLLFAVDDRGNFIPQVGDKVVIERCCSLLASNMWLDTCLYSVRDIDYDNGNLKLWNEDEKQHALCNYLDGVLAGYVFKLPPLVGNFSTKKQVIYYDKGEEPEPEDSSLMARMRREGLIIGEPTVVSSPKKEGRGRSKGSKNRPREVILAERRAWLEQRDLKRAAKAAKKNEAK